MQASNYSILATLLSALLMSRTCSLLTDALIMVPGKKVSSRIGSCTGAPLFPSETRSRNMKGGTGSNSSGNGSRRDFLSTTTTTVGVLGMGSVLVGATALKPDPAQAAGNNEVLSTVLARLRVVPTFCIVNTQGSPFMVINKQEAMAKGYAFTSMEGAVIVLADAQKTAEEGGYADIWADATVITLPADVAVRLALQKRDRVPSRGGASFIGTLIDIIPTTENREDAIQIDKRKFQDQGKTPLFYLESDELVSPDGSNSKPLFLQKQALLDEWTKQHPGEPPRPPLLAIDLTYLCEAALRGYTDRIPNGGNVSFVADPEQVKIANRMRKQGLTMFNFDRVIV